MSSNPHRACTARSAMVCAVCLAATPTAFGAQGVVITGLQVDYGDEVNRNPGNPFGADTGFTIDDVCAASPLIGMALQDMLGAIEREMANAGAPLTLQQIESMPGAPNRQDIARDLANAREALCDAPDPETSVQPFTITYASCRMGMTTPANAMVITMPPGGDSAIMLAADHTTREVVHLELTSHIDATSQFTGTGWSEGIDIASLGQTAEIFGYDTEHYRFSYTSGLGEAGLGAMTAADVEAGGITSPQALGNLVSVESTGTAWISDSAPGIDIVQSFYRNLSSRFQPDSSTSFFGGMIKNLVGMLEKGLPIVIEQTTSAKVMGTTSVSGKSESHVANIRIWDLPAGWCGEVQAPPGYEVTNVNEQMNAAASTPGTPSDAEMREAMNQYSEAMENMTDEQRAMMEQFGMGEMMQQMMGSSPGAQQAGGGGSSAGSAVSPSEELQSDDLTQMVQNHLQALGYDPGNTSGEMTMETTIAISQFQAEKGLEVTGEVSPQLAGMLSAEVDRRRGN